MTSPILTAAQAKSALRRQRDPETARFLQGFFRTEKGGYGEGDRFLGLTVPIVRQVARQFRSLAVPEIGKLLASKVHEDRHLAVILLAQRAQRVAPDEGRLLADFYLRNRARVNNWDLVDASAEHVLGPFLAELSPELGRLASSRSVWDRRIAILAHMHELRKGETKRYFRFATRFLRDDHDLIHKAVGWLLREAGKSDPAGLRAFLEKHAARMPRTMLRYSIEKLPEPERKRVLAKGKPGRV